MSLDRIFGVAGGAMDAQVIRMNLAISNIANAEVTESNSEDAYKAKRPVFETILADEVDARRGETQGGVRVQRIVEDQSTNPANFDPGHPHANEDGYVYMSNVNSVQEMASMMAASRSYQTNVEVMNTAKDLLMRTLTIGQQ